MTLTRAQQNTAEKLQAEKAMAKIAETKTKTDESTDRWEAPNTPHPPAEDNEVVSADEGDSTDSFIYNINSTKDSVNNVQPSPSPVGGAAPNIQRAAAGGGAITTVEDITGDSGTGINEAKEDLTPLPTPPSPVIRDRDPRIGDASATDMNGNPSRPDQADDYHNFMGQGSLTKPLGSTYRRREVH